MPTKPWSNKMRVRGTALLALHELRRTGRTSFDISRQDAWLMERANGMGLRTKITMAALLAVDELQSRMTGAYRVESSAMKRNHITVVASEKRAPMIIRKAEEKVFEKFGLEYRGGTRGKGNDSKARRVLLFRPLDASDLIRA